MVISYFPITRSGRYSAAAAAATALTQPEAAQSASEQDGWWTRRWSGPPRLKSAIIHPASDAWLCGSYSYNPVAKSGAFYRDILPLMRLDRYQHLPLVRPQGVCYCRTYRRPSCLYGTPPLAGHKLRYKSVGILGRSDRVTVIVYIVWVFFVYRTPSLLHPRFTVQQVMGPCDLQYGTPASVECWCGRACCSCGGCGGACDDTTGEPT